MPDMKDITSARKLVDKVATESAVAADFRQDPEKYLRQLAATEAIPNNLVYWMIIGAIGLALIISLLGSVLIVAFKVVSPTLVPDILITTASTALGALAGALVPMSRTNGNS